VKEAEARYTVGQIFATRLPDWSKFDLESFPISNYIIFKDDLESTFERSREKLNQARTILNEHGIEPLFMVDEEGGRVSQIERFFTPAPSPLAIAEHAPEMVSEIYARVSTCLLELGIDINLFPCLDVMTEPLNPIIGTRSFGRTPEKVIACSRAAIAASRRYLCCVGKHFPGHGMTRSDSHLEKPIVVTPRSELEAIHLPPFKEAIKTGIDGFMISHCHYVAMQATSLPASLSPQVVKKFLRSTLAFDGIVITDSLDMKAVSSTIEPVRLGLLAFEAGSDILLFTEFSDRLVGAFESLVEATLMGKIDIGELRMAIDRRRRLLQRLSLVRSLPLPNLDFDYEALVAEVRERSIRIRGSRDRLPITCNEVTLLTTSEAIIGRIRKHNRHVLVPTVPEDVSGKPLILWLVEPLHVPQAFRQAAAMVKQSELSILVSSHDGLVDILPPCDVTITTHDTGTSTVNRVLATILGEETAEG